MSIAHDEFFRRYATSPIHVPRLERLLAVYALPQGEEHFIRSYLEWDRAAGDPEAGRIVTEILPQLVDDRGQIVRLTDQAIQGAIDWLSKRGSVPLAERAALLRTILGEAVQAPPAT